MKQYITEKQLAELGIPLVDTGKLLPEKEYECDYLYWEDITIGQMIEFLSEKYESVEIMPYYRLDHERCSKCKHTQTIRIKDFRWKVVIKRIDGECYPPLFIEKELVDALWGAVKFSFGIEDI